MPNGGWLIISTSKVKVTATKVTCEQEPCPGEYVCLNVSDDGCGILPDHLPRIFEPFFTTKEIGSGTGLGLAFVYGTVNQHQGWIDVTSKVNHGTTCKVFLPVVKKPLASLPVH
jgi:signal transduction histidine kinase